MIKRNYQTTVIRNRNFTIEHLLIHQAVVTRGVKKRAPGGSISLVWETVQPSLACRFTVYTPRTTATINEQQEEYPTKYKLFTAGAADVLKADRILFKGKTYEVVDNPLNPSALNHHYEVELKLLD